MELNVMEYNTTSIRYLNQKKTLNIIFLFLFAVSMIASGMVFFMLFKHDVQISIYLITIAQIAASLIYIVTCIAIAKDCDRLLNAIVEKGSFKEDLDTPYKIDLSRKISKMAIVYFVCAGAILVATIFCVMALILTFSISMLAEVLFMVLILLFALLMSISTIIEDNRIKATLKKENK